MFNAFVDPTARREAVRLRQCPVYHDQDSIAHMTSPSLTAKERAALIAEHKPNTFAHFSIYIDKMFDLTFSEREHHGPLGLQLSRQDDRMAPAQLEDARTWRGLARCWIQTLHYNMSRVLTNTDNAEGIVSLRGLWRLRSSGFRTLEGHMLAGIYTAVDSCTAIAYGMNNHLDVIGTSSSDKRIILPRSYGPVMQVASLETAQNRAFSEAYLGLEAHESMGQLTVVPCLDKVRDDIYHLDPTRRLNFAGPIEALPTKEGTPIGEQPPFLPGGRIGCPILLTPHQAQDFWAAYTQTLETANLL